MSQLKDVKVLTAAALLVAIATVLSFFSVPVNEFIQIRFKFLPIAASGMLFGPAIGGLVGLLADITGYIVKPTGAFFPGYTISTMVSGIIFGAMLYKKKLTIPRVIMTSLVYTVVVSLILNPINSMILYKTPLWVVLAEKLPATAVMFPINTCLLYFVLKTLQSIPLFQDQYLKESRPS